MIAKVWRSLTQSHYSMHLAICRQGLFSVCLLVQILIDYLWNREFDSSHLKKGCLKPRSLFLKWNLMHIINLRVKPHSTCLVCQTSMYLRIISRLLAMISLKSMQTFVHRQGQQNLKGGTMKAIDEW